jgi:hypothetical protein
MFGRVSGAPDRWATGRAVAALLVGLGVGLAVVGWAATERPDALRNDAFVIWALLAVALTAASGLVFEVGYRAYGDVSGWLVVPHRSTSRKAVATVAVVGVALVALTLVVRGASAATARGLVLSLTAVGGGAFVIRTLFAIRTAVPLAPSHTPAGDQVSDYLRMRAVVRELLPPLGALVALATVALGAAMRMDTAGPVDPARQDVVLAFGAGATLLVAVPYLAARRPLRRWGRALVLLLAPIDASGAEAVIAQLELRVKVAGDLDVDERLADELGAGLWITGPLLASIAARFLTAQ